MCGISACLTLPPGCHFHTETLNGYANGTDGQNGIKAEEDIEASKGLRDQLNLSLDAISHRGPDAKGVWVSADGFVGQCFPDLQIRSFQS